jgi:Fe-S cluster biogenesis protein NfuA/rhodanese-related sulfurtransferase
MTAKKLVTPSFDGQSYEISPDDCLVYRRKDEGQAFLIDLRSKEEFDQDHLMGSYSIPASYLEDYVHQMPSHAKMILFAGEDNIAIEAIRLLTENEFEDIHYVVGGYAKIQEALRTSKAEIFLTDFPEDQWEKQINQVLADKVLPVLAADGGGLTVEKVEKDRVFIQFEGACNGCPSSTSGELNFIKNTLGVALNHTIDVEVLS